MAIEIPPSIGDVMSPSRKTCAVLGGRGFLGRSLVFKLLQLGGWIVRVADSPHSLQLDLIHPIDSLLNDALSSGHASYHHFDVRDIRQITKAIEGSSIVFYMEPSDLQKDDFYHCYMTIVQGAKNVITACRGCRVRELIYNSSADVIFNGSHDICNVNESSHCNWNFEDKLTDLKAQAEALILFANNIDGLLTCALRPSNVFGPGDTELVPFLVNLAKSGWAKFIIGSGENMSDFTYAENVIHAHICAARALESRMISVTGKAFFITNLEPVKFWEFVSLILEGLGYQRPFIKLPASMVWHFPLLVNWATEKLASSTYSHALSTHFFHLTSCTRTFNCSAAQKHIGYSPIVSLEEGITRTVESFSHMAVDSSFAKGTNIHEHSKADKLLGSGKVADILLWRDEKKTFTCFLVLALLFHWFFLSGRTLTSSTAKLLLIITTILFGYGILPPNLFGFCIPRMSSSLFKVSDIVVKDLIIATVHVWNSGINEIRLLAEGEDWSKFVKVAFSLYFLKLMLLQSLSAMMGIALVFAFTAFFVYEQYESELDGLAKILSNRIRGFTTQTIPACMASLLQKSRMLHVENGSLRKYEK